MSGFNIGKFNVKSQEAANITGSTYVEFNAQCRQVLIYKNVSAAISVIDYQTSINWYVYKSEAPQKAIMEYETSASSVRALLAPKIEKLEISYEAGAKGAILGETVLNFKSDLKLKPGDVLEVDNCELTVTLNGENALSFLTDDSELFDFLPGENEIIVGATGQNGLIIETLWKDRWL